MSSGYNLILSPPSLSLVPSFDLTFAPLILPHYRWSVEWMGSTQPHRCRLCHQLKGPDGREALTLAGSIG